MQRPRKWSPPTRRDALVTVLTLATGSLDAVAFLRLGGVFTSVMTANMVLLGISAGNREGSLALHAGAAFGGYILGVFAGSRIAGRAEEGQPTWPHRVRVAVGVELAVLAAFAVGWELTTGNRSSVWTYALLAVTAIALGIQSSAVLRLGVPGLSTTYLTRLLTQFVADFQRGNRTTFRSTAILVGLVAGGALGALLAIEAPRLPPIVPLGVVALVLIGSRAALQK